ncbi:MAG: hypothetical protein HC893_14540, partial [Chloroflexaceae bacterium]|nr:hypothetical protein [Chloroflexaceae bacterium]
EHDEAFGQAWHIPSPQTVTTREFLTIVYEEAGHPLKLSVIPPLMIRVVSLFVPRLRGIEENFYQFSEPYIVDASKFKRAFGDIATPLREAIRQTVAWYRAIPLPESHHR